MRASNKTAFTIIELLIVVSIIGIVAMMGLPRASKIMAANEMRSAKLEVKSALVLARSSAVQNGAFAQFVRAGNIISVTADSAGQQVLLGSVNDIFAGHKVLVTSSMTTIRFDPRGFAFGISGAPFYQVIRISRGSLSDSICVTRLGRINSEGVCQ